MTQVIDKKVKMKLVGINGNAFAIMGAFSKKAREQGWTKEQINSVLSVAKNGDYNNLLATIVAHVDNPFEDEDDYDNEDYE